MGKQAYNPESTCAKADGLGVCAVGGPQKKGWRQTRGHPIAAALVALGVALVLAVLPWLAGPFAGWSNRQWAAGSVKENTVGYLPANRFVVIAVSGLSWSDVPHSSQLWRLGSEQMSFNLVTRSMGGAASCPTQGWAQLAGAVGSQADLPGFDQKYCQSIETQLQSAALRTQLLAGAQKGVLAQAWQEDRKRSGNNIPAVVPTSGAPRVLSSDLPPSGLLGDYLQAYGIKSVGIGPGAAIALAHKGQTSKQITFPQVAPAEVTNVGLAKQVLDSSKNNPVVVVDASVPAVSRENTNRDVDSNPAAIRANTPESVQATVARIDAILRVLGPSDLAGDSASLGQETPSIAVLSLADTALVNGLATPVNGQVRLQLGLISTGGTKTSIGSVAQLRQPGLARIVDVQATLAYALTKGGVHGAWTEEDALTSSLINPIVPDGWRGLADSWQYRFASSHLMDFQQSPGLPPNPGPAQLVVQAQRASWAKPLSPILYALLILMVGAGVAVGAGKPRRQGRGCATVKGDATNGTGFSQKGAIASDDALIKSQGKSPIITKATFQQAITTTAGLLPLALPAGITIVMVIAWEDFALPYFSYPALALIFAAILALLAHLSGQLWGHLGIAAGEQLDVWLGGKRQGEMRIRPEGAVWGSCYPFQSATLPVLLLCFWQVTLLFSDIVAGSRLQLDSPIGVQSTLGSRFFGANNTSATLLIVSALVCTWLVLQPLSRRTRGGAIVAALGALACAGVVLLVESSPTLGADLGGIPMIGAGFLLLALSLAGLRLTVGKMGAILACSAGLFVAFALWDYTRPVAVRTHLGQFVGALWHGQAGPILLRKAAAGATQLGLAALAVVALLSLALLLQFFTYRGRKQMQVKDILRSWRKYLSTIFNYARNQVWWPLFVAIFAVLIIGALVNDSSAVVLGMGGYLLVSIALAGRLLRDASQTRPAPGKR